MRKLFIIMLTGTTLMLFAHNVTLYAATKYDTKLPAKVDKLVKEYKEEVRR